VFAQASAIVIADALVWDGADSSILEAVRHIDAFGQGLVLALIFRAVTDSILDQNDTITDAGPDDPYAPAVTIACQVALGTSSQVSGTLNWQRVRKRIVLTQLLYPKAVSRPRRWL